MNGRIKRDSTFASVVLFALLSLFLISSCGSNSSKKSSFQDFGFDYFYSYDSDLLLGNYAIALKDSMMFSYISIEHGVAYEDEKTTPKYGIPNGEYIALEVYQLVEEIDSVYTYEKIQNFKLDGRDVIVHSFDAKMTQLKFIENNKLIYGSSVQDGGKSNIYNKKIDKIKASISTRKILSRTNIYKHR